MDGEQQRIARINGLFEDAAAVYSRLAPIAPTISRAVDLVIAAYRSGGKLITFGNGGSAADAQHIAAEMLGRFRIDREPWPAIALTTNTSVLTAIGNDFGYNEVFSRQIKAWARTGDVALGISTSGKSKNVIQGLAQARKQGAVTIGFCGAVTETLDRECDVVISVPATDTPRIQEAHILIGHIICEEVERVLSSDNTRRNT